MVVDVNYVIESDVTVINIQWRQLAPSEMAISRQLHASDANRGYCWQGTKQAKALTAKLQIIKKFENHWSKIGYWSKLGATEDTLIEILLSWKLSLLKIGLTENGYTENGYTENVLYWGRLIL